jgi:hypothetical protein
MGARSALWACAIMAAAQPEIQFAQEARGYALWQALGLCASASAARLVVYGPGWRRAIGLSICLVGLILTHFLALATVAAIAVWCAFYLRGRALRQALICAAAGMAFLAIVAGGLITQAFANHNDAMWLRESPDGHLAMSLLRAAALPATFLADIRKGQQWVSCGTAVVYLIAGLLAIRNRGMAWCFFWLTAGIGSVFCMDMMMGTRALSTPRYTFIAAPALYLLLASLPLKGWMRDVIPLIALFTCVLAVPLDYDGPTWKGDWRGLGEDVRKAAGPDDLVLFANEESSFLMDPLKTFDAVSFYCQPFPCDVALVTQTVDAPLMQRINQAKHVWVVSVAGRAQLEGYLPGWNVAIAGPNRLFAGYLWEAKKKENE